jgi:hypothetical protein
MLDERLAGRIDLDAHVVSEHVVLDPRASGHGDGQQHQCGTAR